MFADRFDYAVAHVDLDMSRDRVLVVGPVDLNEYPQLTSMNAEIYSDSFLVVRDALDRGLTASAEIVGEFDTAIVCCPRSKPLARHFVGLASRAVGPKGRIILDGNKTDGIEPLLKAVKAETDLDFTLSKAHGKIALVTGGDLSDWIQDNYIVTETGLKTKIGVFSADGIDAGSAFLLEHIPTKLGARVADLGAGWGYLSSQILERFDVKSLHLVESQKTALECARENCADDRVSFHWADAMDWKCKEPLDAIVMNPPFHVGRAADPSLGLAFIRSAARNLASHGQLIMVANRQLPYEEELNARFARVEEVAKNGRFKVFHASRPRKVERTRRS